MVLLTSSAISVAISSGIVATFTFLLFLSGYVLQQQTVRSLQEQLHRPREPIPIPTLPARFQTRESVIEADRPIATIEAYQEDALDVVEVNVLAEGEPESLEEDVLNRAEVERGGPQTRLISNEADTSISTKEEFERLRRKPSLLFGTVAKHKSPPPPPPSSHLHAYILPLLNPRDLCSALLFSKTYTEKSRLDPRPPIILLYPSFWESPSAASPSDTSSYTIALELMRSAIDSPSHAHIILHPAPVSLIWFDNLRVVESAIISELQSYGWSFDRMLYLRSPGLAVDVAALDSALQMSDIRKSWSLVRSQDFVPPAKTSSGAGRTPMSVMLISGTRGILRPRAEMRGISASATTSHENHHENEMDIEARVSAKGAAWVVFDEAELQHRRGEREWFGGLVQRFERGRAEVCPDTMLRNRS